MLLCSQVWDLLIYKDFKCYHLTRLFLIPLNPLTYILSYVCPIKYLVSIKCKFLSVLHPKYFLNSYPTYFLSILAVWPSSSAPWITKQAPNCYLSLHDFFFSNSFQAIKESHSLPKSPQAYLAHQMEHKLCTLSVNILQYLSPVSQWASSLPLPPHNLCSST